MCGSTYCMNNPLRSGEPPNASSRVDATFRLLEPAIAGKSPKLELMARKPSGDSRQPAYVGTRTMRTENRSTDHFLPGDRAGCPSLRLSRQSRSYSSEKIN